jgi:hypothetical protein
MNHQVLKGKILKWIAITAAALLAMRQFFVQELIVEVLVFAAFFACIVAVALVLLAIDQAWQFASGRIEMHMRAFGRLLLRNRTSVGSSSPVHLLTPVLERRTTSHR